MNEIALPCDKPAERLILGSIILDHQSHTEAFRLLSPEDFSIEVHRQIYSTMHAMDAGGETIDRVTLAGRLHDLRLLESVGGLTALAYLDEGLPQIPNIEGYIDVVREKSALRKIIFSAQHLIDRCVTAQGDSAELIALADRTLMQIKSKTDATARRLNPGEVIEAAGGVDRFINPVIGARTPWDVFTEMTGGYRKGELFVIGGNPGMGKSAAALQVAMRCAQDGLPTLYFSLEMTRESLVRRMACYRGRIDSAKLRAGYLNKEERSRLLAAINEISKLPLWIIEHGISNVSAIRAELRSARAQSDVFMIVIDYLQLLQSIGKQNNRNTEVAEITRQLKLMAMDENVNVQLLSQLNRDNMKERRAPEPRDLRESGSIEQDADAVAFVWRPELLFREREDLKGVAELILVKQRNGPTGKIELVWLGNITAFENRAEDFRDEQ